MFKTREDLESHYHLEGHSATNTELPAESSTVSSRSCDAVPDPPCEIFDSEEEDADAGVPTSSVSGTTNIDRSLRTRLSSQKIRNCQDRAELVKNVQKTAIGAPKEVQKSLSSKTTEVVKESNMNLEKTAAITTLCEAEQATDVLLKTSTAQICDAAGSANSDVLSAGASVEQNVPVPASSASSLSDTGSLTTVDTGDKSPDNMNAASVPPNGHNVTSCRPPRRAVRRDNIPSEKSSSVCARKTRRKINPSGSDKAAESNSKKRKTNDSDDNDNDDGDEHDDYYEDNSDGDDDPEADDSDYSKSDDNIDKRGALKGFDFRCPIKDCDRSFNKVLHSDAVAYGIKSSKILKWIP